MEGTNFGTRCSAGFRITARKPARQVRPIDTIGGLGNATKGEGKRCDGAQVDAGRLAVKLAP
jgi:hypothetical protein